jgi:hypothetical protein
MGGGRHLPLREGRPFFITVCGFGGVAIIRFSAAFTRRSVFCVGIGILIHDHEFLFGR